MLRSTLLLSSLLCLGLTAQAADKPAAPPPVKPGWTLLPDEVAEAKTEKTEKTTVSEDDSTRIEETRVRGQVKTVKVHLKNSVFPDYEIQMSDAGYELPGSKIVPVSTGSGTTGKRFWRVLDF